MADPIVVTIAILSFLMAFSIGANDAANALATSYGSNALSIIPLCLCGSVFEFIGACWGSQKVAKNLAYDMISNLDEQARTYQVRLMLAVSIASFCFIMASSVFGMPISGTHTVISALVGAGLVGCGASNIAWLQVVKIISSWVISPLLSSLACLGLIMICCAFTLGGFEFGLKVRLFSLTLIVAFSFALTAYMSITLFQTSDTIKNIEYVSIPIAFLLGLIVARAIILNLLMTRQNCGAFICYTLSIWNYGVFEKMLEVEKLHASQIDRGNNNQSMVASKLSAFEDVEPVSSKGGFHKRAKSSNPAKGHQLSSYHTPSEQVATEAAAYEDLEVKEGLISDRKLSGPVTEARSADEPAGRFDSQMKHSD